MGLTGTVFEATGQLFQPVTSEEDGLARTSRVVSRDAGSVPVHVSIEGVQYAELRLTVVDEVDEFRVTGGDFQVTAPGTIFSAPSGGRVVGVTGAGITGMPVVFVITGDTGATFVDGSIGATVSTGFHGHVDSPYIRAGESGTVAVSVFVGGTLWHSYALNVVAPGA